MANQTWFSPRSGTLAGLPFHKWVQSIAIHDGQASFQGHMPMDVAQIVIRANRTGEIPTFPGPLVNEELAEHLRHAGDALLDQVKANFESMDAAEAAADRQDAIEILRNWWYDLAEREVDATVPKAVEYGSTDLIDIGRNIARLSGRTVSDQEAAEIGIFFYLEGKLARWRSAIAEGRLVSDDTLFDIGVYVRMAQRVRSAGSWPGVEVQ
jgi:hypothetical protein